MPAAPARRKFNRSTFAKLWALLFAASALPYGVFRIAGDGSAFGGGNAPGRDLLKSRAESLSRIAEEAMLADVRGIWLSEPADPDRGSSYFAGWETRYPSVVSADLWRTDGSGPDRWIHDEIAGQIRSRVTDDASRERLDAFLSPKRVSWTLRRKTPYQETAFLGRPFQGSLAGILIPRETRERRFILWIRFVVSDPSEAVRSRLDPGETVRLVNGDSALMVWEMPSSGSRSPAGSTQATWTASAPMSILSWRIEILRQTAGTAPAGGSCRALFLCFLVCLLISGTAAFAGVWWIERPFERLMSSAIEIGRGNFGIRISDQKNRSMHRLAKLLNYMATEMDHLQRMNVSAIINEKNKTEIMLRNIADGVLVLDEEGKIVLMNETASRWLRLNESAVLGRPFQECIRIRPLAALLRDVLKDKPNASDEFVIKAAEDRSTLVLAANAARVTNRDGRNVGAVTVLRDVTKEKEADRIKTELVSMVAHELKSPLTSIYGFTELLLDPETKNKKAAEYARVIQSEVSRLTDFVDKFLSLSRLESGKIRIQMDPFDLRSVVEKSVSVLQAHAARKDILIALQLPDSLPLTAGDPALIEQVLVNLIGNAIKYSPRQSKIGIETAVGSKDVSVHVIDNGYGIPKESLPKIFDKFYRVAEMRESEETEGSGLGLALVKEIVEKHGGFIKVKSKLGVGSVFSFSLLQAGMFLRPGSGENL
ncbi:PAS domain-containing protein [bacterium]|nr:PAS domain-containing protein [bacterium]